MITTENAKSLIAQLEREIAAHKARYLKAKADRQQLQKSLTAHVNTKNYRS